ncbi:uncharacterized protein DNG_04452 [Cephalotrichum gorgonifer]|uniref:Uncharacterized protein n=1 Tax=Cephalotrichum gorgonifer TaxID=2041049 RepID=A0AAE8MY36_9PEZI|nr:uncharacterized protein DNG_04452 [Cephalotrichum gorgonifer]
MEVPMVYEDVAENGEIRPLLEGFDYERIESYATLNYKKLNVESVIEDSVDLAPANQVCARFEQDLDGFWTATEYEGGTDLRRRLACVVIFLRSKLDAEASVPLQVARVFQGQYNYLDIRNSGRKYIKIARKLGGLGAILWLPVSVSPSTYERYLNIDDEEVFSHLKALAPEAERYANFVQRLVLHHLRGQLSQ